MSNSDQNVRIVIRAEDAGASKTIHGVSTALGGLSKPAAAAANALKPMGPSLVSVASAVGPALIGGIVGFGAALVGAAVAGVSFNANLETTTAALETLLGSTQAAKKRLKELQKFAATTPFEFPELAKTHQLMLAMGFASEDVLPLMEDIGNAVAALGGGSEEVNRVVRALGQMQAKGKVSAEDMMQLTELGIPAWKILADAVGVTVGEVQKMTTDGLIPADTMIQAFTKHSEEAWGGAMQKQAETMVGLWSTIKDNIGLALGVISGPLFEGAKQALQDIAVLVQSPEFAAFGERIAAGFETGFRIVRDSLISLYEGITGTWQDDPDKILPIHRIFGNLGLVMRNLESGIGGVWDTVLGPDQETRITNIATSATQLADALKWIADNTQDLEQKVTDFNKAGEPFAKWLNDSATDTSELGRRLREDFMTEWTKAFGPEGQVVKDLEWMKQWDDPINTKVNGWIDTTIANFVAEWTAAFGPGGKNAKEMEWLATWADPLTAKVQAWLDPLLTDFQTEWALGFGAGGSIEKDLEWMKTWADPINEKVNAWMDAAASFGKGFVDNLLGGLQAEADRITEWWKDFLRDLGVPEVLISGATGQGGGSGPFAAPMGLAAVQAAPSSRACPCQVSDGAATSHRRRTHAGDHRRRRDGNQRRCSGRA